VEKDKAPKSAPPAKPARREGAFSWSVSRHETFRTCLRRYYLHYYASRGGWREDAPAAARELWVLRSLKNRWMWVGDLVHRAVKHSLTNLARGVKVLEADRVVEITLNLMRNEFRASVRGNYRQGRGQGLFEHEYALPVGDDGWKEMASLCERCLRNFYSSELYDSLRRREPSDLLEIETLSSFDLEGNTCWVVLDAAWRDKERVVIADWKTGRGEPGGYELQMTGYALYARERWQVPPESLDLLEFNLQSSRIHRYPIDLQSARRTASFILGSIADMKSLLADPEANAPLGQDRFPRIDEIPVCLRCSFRRVCRPELAGTVAAGDI
jgi:hypothetical protein